MSFNVNYLAGTPEGLIPLNKDSWLKKDRKLIDIYQPPGQPQLTIQERTQPFFTRELFDAYWTVRSFKVSFRLITSSLRHGQEAAKILEPYENVGFMTSKQLREKIGESKVEELLNLKTAFKIEGYTKTRHRYYKTIQELKDGKETGYDNFAERAIGNSPKIGFIYKPTEGSLPSPGPVHFLGRSNFTFELDLSDILYYRISIEDKSKSKNKEVKNDSFWNKVSQTTGWYRPRIVIQAITDEGRISTDFGIGGLVGKGNGIFDVEFMEGESYLPVYYFWFGGKGRTILADCKITPGDRCCDRYFWDGVDRKDTCPSCSDEESPKDTSKDGVYLKENFKRNDDKYF